MVKVLIFYTSVGLGHKVIAENLAAAFEKAGFYVKLSDVLEVQSGRLVDFGKTLLRFFYRTAPFIWSFLYQSEFITRLTLSLRTKVSRRNCKQALDLINEYNPEVIITTQTAASAVVAVLKEDGFYKGKFGIVFSDFHLHRFWLYEQADFYLVNTKEQKQEMISLGVREGIIFDCGFTLKPKNQINPEVIRQKFGLKDNEKVILVSSGSQGIGLKGSALRRLSELKETKIIIVCGKNKKLYDELKSEYKTKNVIVLGYYSSMEELYAISDIFISKPGGMSVAEALAWNLPQVIINNLPGQEELNIIYLKKHNLAIIHPENLLEAVQSELGSKRLKNSLSRSSLISELVRFGNPAVKALKLVLHET